MALLFSSLGGLAQSDVASENSTRKRNTASLNESSVVSKHFHAADTSPPHGSVKDVQYAETVIQSPQIVVKMSFPDIPRAGQDQKTRNSSWQYLSPPRSHEDIVRGPLRQELLVMKISTPLAHSEYESERDRAFQTTRWVINFEEASLHLRHPAPSAVSSASGRRESSASSLQTIATISCSTGTHSKGYQGRRVPAVTKKPSLQISMNPTQLGVEIKKSSWTPESLEAMIFANPTFRRWEGMDSKSNTDPATQNPGSHDGASPNVEHQSTSDDYHHPKEDITPSPHGKDTHQSKGFEGDAVSRASVALDVSMPYCDLSLTKNDYDILMNLYTVHYEYMMAAYPSTEDSSARLQNFSRSDKNNPKAKHSVETTSNDALPSSNLFAETLPETSFSENAISSMFDSASSWNSDTGDSMYRSALSYSTLFPCASSSSSSFAPPRSAASGLTTLTEQGLAELGEDRVNPRGPDLDDSDTSDSGTDLDTESELDSSGDYGQLDASTIFAQASLASHTSQFFKPVLREPTQLPSLATSTVIVGLDQAGPLSLPTNLSDSCSDSANSTFSSDESARHNLGEATCTTKSEAKQENDKLCTESGPSSLLHGLVLTINIDQASISLSEPDRDPTSTSERQPKEPNQSSQINPPSAPQTFQCDFSRLRLFSVMEYGGQSLQYVSIRASDIVLKEYQEVRSIRQIAPRIPWMPILFKSTHYGDQTMQGSTSETVQLSDDRLEDTSPREHEVLVANFIIKEHTPCAHLPSPLKKNAEKTGLMRDITAVINVRALSWQYVVDSAWHTKLQNFFTVSFHRVAFCAFLLGSSKCHVTACLGSCGRIHFRVVASSFAAPGTRAIPH